MCNNINILSLLEIPPFFPIFFSEELIFYNVHNGFVATGSINSFHFIIIIICPKETDHFNFNLPIFYCNMLIVVVRFNVLTCAEKAVRFQ